MDGPSNMLILKSDPYQQQRISLIVGKKKKKTHAENDKKPGSH